MKKIILILIILLSILVYKKYKIESFKQQEPSILYFLTDNIKLVSGIFNSNYLSIKNSIQNNSEFKIVNYYTKFSRDYLKNKILMFDFTNGFNMKINPTRQEINNIIPYLKYSKKNIAILHDLHIKWSFNNKNIDMIPFLKNNNFKVIAYGHSHKTPEHDIFTKNNIKYKNIFHHINFSTFKNLNLEKEYDIIFIGYISRSNYPFRYRLYHIFKNNFNIIHVNKQSSEDLVKIINKSHLGIVTPSKFNYFLQKYIEIPLCNSCPIGNIPDNDNFSRELYQNDYIKLDPSMSDHEIINITKKALLDKKSLLNKSMKIRLRSDKYNANNYSKLLYKISNSI
jgi:hypothetical protein